MANRLDNTSTKTLTPVKPSHRNQLSTDSIIHLQRTIGDQAIEGLVHSSNAFDFGNIRILPKLKITHPGDVYEQEADRVAEQVMRMSLDNLRMSTIPKDEERVSRKCSACEMKEEEKKKGQLNINRKTLSNSSCLETTSDEIAEQINDTNSGSGSLFDATTKEFMESRFGYDFSKVRIHSDERAAKSASSLNALAYTVGNDIVFAEGQYQPTTIEGRRLLAHELTHVVQQTSTFAGHPLSTYELGHIVHQMEANQIAGDLSSIFPATDIVMREEKGNTQRFSGCTSDRISLIEEIRRAAANRCQLAAIKTKGIVTPGPAGLGDTREAAARHSARVIARTIFGEDLNMEQVAEIVSNMGSRLSSSSLTFDCAPANDPDCGARAGYVRGLRPPVHLCRAFFNSSREQQIRTMVHEAAHATGIGETTPDIKESYCVIYDCENSCGGFDVADSWSHYIHCMSNQTPDKPDKPPKVPKR